MEEWKREEINKERKYKKKKRETKQQKNITGTK